MNKLFKAILILALPLIVILPASAQEHEHAVDMGLTPSPVYSLWSNINRAVIIYADLLSDDKGWLKKLDSMGPNKFYNKKPANVLELVNRFSAKLNEIDGGRSAGAAETLLEGNLPNLLSSYESSVTPSLVYLHSGQVLVNIVDDILYISVAPIEISPLFKEYSFIDKGKTPSDVFGLVDLAIRRIDKILIKQKTGKLKILGGAQ